MALPMPEQTNYHSPREQLAYLQGVMAGSLLVGNMAMEQANQETRDPLTGLYNQQGFEVAASSEIANNPESPRGVMLAKIGNFGTIERMLGQTESTALLKETARAVTRVDGTNIVGHFGNGEFALLLNLSKNHLNDHTGRRSPERLLELATMRARDIQARIAGRSPELLAHGASSLFSLGIGSQLIDAHTTFAQAMQIADANLYVVTPRKRKTSD